MISYRFYKRIGFRHLYTPAMETPNATHTLLGKWDVYYHLPLDKNWEFGSYKTIMKPLNPTHWD